MSATSIKSGYAFAGARHVEESSDGASFRELSVLEALSLTSWRRVGLESCVLLAAIALLQSVIPSAAGIPGLPHPYWLPVLLASCQYGVSGGVIAAVAASSVYFLKLSSPSATQDLYSYATMALVQPTLWLATALILGGVRNLHIHQSLELSDLLAANRRRSDDLAKGLERAAIEINALERRIAIDMASVAAFSRSLSQIDLRDRKSAAQSIAELFRIATGTPDFIIYLRTTDSYVPVFEIEANAVRSPNGSKPLELSSVDATLVESGCGIARNEGNGRRRCVVHVPSMDSDAAALAVIVCDLHQSQDMVEFLGRSNELSRALTAILSVCSEPGTPEVGK
jgi:hypothetical protein